jgi:hypothetical protein
LVERLLGKTLVAVRGAVSESDEIAFHCGDGTNYRMYHQQDCCESVLVDDVVGDIEDLIGSPIVRAEERSESGEATSYGDSATWTFYELATNRGSVTIKWYGSSNGYYSERVDFEETNGPNHEE